MKSAVQNSSWKTVRLGDAAKTASGGTPSRGKAAYYDGNIPWVKSGELGDSTVFDTEEKITQAALDSSSAKIFPKGTLCIALYGATVGKLGILGMDAATNQAVCGIFLPKEIDTRFAYRFLESKRRDLIEMGKGGAQSNISQQIIRELEFPFPPTDEQRRIVAEIEKQFTRLEAGVAALRRVQANLKRYRAAVLKAACEGQLVSIKGKIKTTTVAEVITGLGQGWSPKCDLTRDPLPDEWAIIKTTAVQSMKYLDSEAKPLPTKFEPRPHIEVKAGDLLMTRKGPRQRCGVACLVRSTRPKLMVCDTVYRFRCKEEIIAPSYLEFVLNTPPIVTAIDRKKSGISDSGVSLTHDKLGEIEIPLPPLAEQTRIVAEVERRLSVVEELESVVSVNLQRSVRLRQSILQKAFTGQLA